MDKALRLWNFQDKSSELISFFDAAPLAVSLHPSGLYLLVSFGEKVMKSRLPRTVRADSALLSFLGVKIGVHWMDVKANGNTFSNYTFSPLRVKVHLFGCSPWACHARSILTV